LVGLLETITSSSNLKVRNELSTSFETKEGEEKLYPDDRSNLGREVTYFPALEAGTFHELKLVGLLDCIQLADR
jgi:hypothetical protein